MEILRKRSPSIRGAKSLENEKRRLENAPSIVVVNQAKSLIRKISETIKADESIVELQKAATKRKALRFNE